jgi:hypothetical protein
MSPILEGSEKEKGAEELVEKRLYSEFWKEEIRFRLRL